MDWHAILLAFRLTLFAGLATGVGSNVVFGILFASVASIMVFISIAEL